jgi:hypothetical protein
MFELPLSTTLLLVGFPLFWVAYTIVFLLKTRNWGKTENQTAKRPEDDS